MEREAAALSANEVRADLSDAMLRDAGPNGAEPERAPLSGVDPHGSGSRGRGLTHVGFDEARAARIGPRDAVGFRPEREHEIDGGEGDEPAPSTGHAARDRLLGRVYPHGERSEA